MYNENIKNYSLNCFPNILYFSFNTKRESLNRSRWERSRGIRTLERPWTLETTLGQPKDDVERRRPSPGRTSCLTFPGRPRKILDLVTSQVGRLPSTRVRTSGSQAYKSRVFRESETDGPTLNFGLRTESKVMFTGLGTSENYSFN